MSSKEVIKQIKKIGDYIAQSNAWDIRDELYKCCDKLERELEILEILKYRIHLKKDTIKNDTKDYDIAWVEASGFVFSEEYTLLKKWLEDIERAEVDEII